MGDFSAAWLALREQADHAARSRRLSDALAPALRARINAHVVDLGAGTGSNLRYLAPRLPALQRWVLVDRDPDLLAEAAARSVDVPVSIEMLRLDLNRIDEDTVARLFESCALVTASALLDLVSERWIVSIAQLASVADAAALFALTYDGRIRCVPSDPVDETIRELVNEHQHRDKGFGRALGPDATDVAAREFALRGYRIERDHSDWVLDNNAGELQQELVRGWARAAAEIAPLHASAVDAWRTRKLARIAAGESQIIVGHEDLIAVRGGDY